MSLPSYSTHGTKNACPTRSVGVKLYFTQHFLEKLSRVRARK